MKDKRRSTIPGIAIVTYRLNGLEHTWSIGCLIGEDDEKSIRKHLAKHIPGAEFLKVDWDPKDE
jgi:hypothetical protein